MKAALRFYKCSLLMNFCTFNRAIKNDTRACAASHIKILIDVVDYIWDSVDRADFTRATLLFLLARYIKTSKLYFLLYLYVF